MPDSIRMADYFYVTVADKPGEGVKVLSALKEDGVNLRAFCGFPMGGGRSQLDFVTEDPNALRESINQVGLRLSERKKVFLVEGEERTGAAAEIFEKLAAEGINIIAAQAVCAGSNRWGMIFWVKPSDYEQASKALGL